jgi:hypothetical protein
VKPIEWTEKHQKFGVARLGELISEAAYEGRRVRVERLARGVIHVVACEEHHFREHLRGAWFDAARIDREVRRIDRLARGEWAREMVWRVRYSDGRLVSTTGDLTRDDAVRVVGHPWHGRLVRVTRFRRTS